MSEILEKIIDLNELSYDDDLSIASTTVNISVDDEGNLLDTDEQKLLTVQQFFTYIENKLQEEFNDVEPTDANGVSVDYKRNIKFSDFCNQLGLDPSLPNRIIKIKDLMTNETDAWGNYKYKTIENFCDVIIYNAMGVFNDYALLISPPGGLDISFDFKNYKYPDRCLSPANIDKICQYKSPLNYNLTCDDECMDIIFSDDSWA